MSPVCIGIQNAHNKFPIVYNSDERPKEKVTSNGAGSQKGSVPGRGSASGMSSLQGLPSLTGDRTAGRKSRKYYKLE